MLVKVDSVTIKKNAAKTKIYNQLLASFGFIPSIGSESKIFKDFQFFNQSEAMATILDVGQGHKIYLTKRIIQGVSHPSLV